MNRPILIFLYVLFEFVALDKSPSGDLSYHVHVHSNNRCIVEQDEGSKSREASNHVFGRSVLVSYFWCML
jgi:hypothetical protein